MVLAVAVLGFIVFVEQGQRRIPVQYAKRVVGRRHIRRTEHTSAAEDKYIGCYTTHFRIIDHHVSGNRSQLHYDPLVENHCRVAVGRVGLIYEVAVYRILIFFFCYFYTAVTFNPSDVAENMKKHGGFIPGIRPGKRTADYIDRVLTRITLGGAIYVSAVCVLPSLLVTRLNVPFYFGGTALLIVVGVAIDTVAQMESHMLTRHYEGFLKRAASGDVSGG